VERLVPRGAFLKGYPQNPNTFGEHLRKARMDAGLQIKELAEQLGVSQDSVINWETRGVRPAKWNIPALVRTLPQIKPDVDTASPKHP